MKKGKIATKYIMGIQSFANQDSGACIIKCSNDGKILDYIAISEERLIREKYPYVFPVHSIGYCMDYFGLQNLDQINLLISDYIRIKRWFNSGPGYNISDYDYLKIKFDLDPRKIRTITHHMAHAASTFYPSGFDEAAILVIDGNGSDLETTSYFYGKDLNIKLIENFKYHGIGACYSSVTKNILNLGTGGEGKTMGLAPYGEKNDKVLYIDAHLDGIKNDFSGFMKRMSHSDVLNQMDPRNRIYLFKRKYRKCKNEKELLNPYFSRVAYDVQKETERVLVHLANDLYSKTGSKNICIAGGVGLNSVSNKIMLDKCAFENIFIFPACSDAGIPFGLAIWGYYNCNDISGFKKKKLQFRNTYIGIEYSDEYTKNMLGKYNISNSEAKLNQIAELISKGKIVGWFQGGSEYGPRALGHRSILADSRDKNMKDILNLKIKHRESFRPYAPSVLEEYCSEYFDLDCESPYMLLIAKVKKPKVIPAVTHMDNTARVQIVTKRDNDIFYDLIKEFYKITGVPCILNTSFNEAGESIVETPEDAVMCFLKSKMDYLVIGKYLLAAKKIQDKDRIFNHMVMDRKEKIKARRNELIKLYFKGYNDEERDYFIAESNKISEWYVKYKCKYELERKVLSWIESNKKILIVGTRDHTMVLPKTINYFCLLNIVGFCNFKNYFDSKRSDSIDYPEYKLEDTKNIDYDEILISSFEYNFEIYDYLSKADLGKAIYTIYDNTSRDLAKTLNNFPFFKNKR